MQIFKKHILTLLVIAAVVTLFPNNIFAQTDDASNPEVNYRQINEMQASFDKQEKLKSECRGFVCCTGPDCDFDAFLSNLDYIIKKILEYAFVFMALMFAYAGFKYIKSAGDPSGISEAHSMFKKAAIGTLIVLLSFLIVELITSSLGLDEGIIKLNK